MLNVRTYVPLVLCVSECVCGQRECVMPLSLNCCCVVCCGSAATSLCPLLAWNRSSTMLGILCVGMDFVLLWRRSVRDLVRVAVDSVPTSLWWSTLDPEVLLVGPATGLWVAWPCYFRLQWLAICG